MLAPALPECGPREPARWEGPRAGGVLSAGRCRGGGGRGRWEEPRGSGCPGEATLGPRRGRGEQVEERAAAAPGRLGRPRPRRAPSALGLCAEAGE